MITDGCVIMPGARVERSILSPGVMVEPGALIRESVILTGATIGPNARIDRTIIDKRVRVGEGAQVGSLEASPQHGIAMLGKKCVVPPGMTIEAGAIIGTDVNPDDYPGPTVRGDDYVQTKRLAYEV